MVDSNTGIGDLEAYGVGANVNSDLAYNVNDVPMTLNVGAGGVPGQINAGNLSDTVVQGFLNLLTVTVLEGNCQATDVKNEVVKETKKRYDSRFFTQH